MKKTLGSRWYTRVARRGLLLQVNHPDGRFGSWTERILLLIGLGLFIYKLAALERQLMYGLLVDDAYISARHALNLVNGGGLNFNPGEKIEGYTNFLFTLLMVVPHLLHIPLEPFVRTVGALSAIGVLLLSWRLAGRIAGPLVATILCAALLLDDRFVFFATWGLETVFGSLPCLLGYVFLSRRRPAAAGIAFAAAAMTRIDMLVLTFPAFLYLLISPVAREERLQQQRPSSRGSGASNSRRTPLRWALERDWVRLGAPLASIFGTYFLLRWWYYGWLLPNTFYAKVAPPAKAWQRGWSYVTECFSKMGIGWLMVAAAAAWLLCGICLLFPKARRRAASSDAVAQAVTLCTAAVAYLAYVVSVGGDHFQERFIYHAFPFIAIAAVAPFRLLPSFLVATNDSAQTGWLRWAPSATYALIFAAFLPAAPHRFGRANVVAGWISLGRYLKERAPARAVLATDAAGALPYYSGLKTIDVLGLADIHIGHIKVATMGQGPVGHEKSDPLYVIDQNPEYISTWLDPDGGAGRGFSRQGGFSQKYRLAALVRTDTTEVTSERILPFETTEPSAAELIKLRDGHGTLPGNYDWALYERRNSLEDYWAVGSSGFRSNLPGWSPNPNYLVAAEKGHIPTHILWGPFIELVPATYDGYVKLKVGDLGGLDPRQRLCVLEVYDGKRSLTETPLLANIPSRAEGKLSFSFEVARVQPVPKIEFRMYCWGHADITVERVYLSKPH